MLALILATVVAVKTPTVVKHYDRVESKLLVPMLSEVIRFETYAENAKAHAAQKTWLVVNAHSLGFVSRMAGKVTEIELPASVKGAPVLGLVVHGDVQTVDAAAWSFPPFSGKTDAQYVYGRGAADDKGPLVQALLAMKARNACRMRSRSGCGSRASPILAMTSTRRSPSTTCTAERVC